MERRGQEVRQKTGRRRRTERLRSKGDGMWRKMRRGGGAMRSRVRMMEGKRTKTGSKERRR